MNGGYPCADPPFLGVQCDSEGRVQSISLVNRDLVGSVPDELSQVNELISLNLDQNKLTGVIPNTLNNLVHLQSASICCNLLSGQIPDLSPMTALNLLHLDGNFLQDAIPESLANLLQLKDLQLNNNHLSGTVPSVLGNLQALTVLRLDHNYLSGTLPSSLTWLATTPNAVFNFTENLSDFCGPAGLGVPLCPDDPNYVPPGAPAPPPSAPPSVSPPSSPSPSPVLPAPPAPSGGDAPPSNSPPTPTPDSSGSSNLSPSDSTSGGGNSSSSSNSSSSGGGGVSVAVIAGVAGGVAALAVMGLLACYCLRARKRKTVVNAAAGGAAGGTGEAAEMMEKGQVAAIAPGKGGSAGKAGAAARIASIKKASASAEGGASGRRGVGGSGRGGADAAPGAVESGAGAQANSRPSPITITVEKAGAATGDVTAPLISATGGTTAGGGGGGAGAAAGAVAGVAAVTAAVGVGAAVAASQDKRKSSPKETNSIRGSSSARSSTDGEDGGGASASGRNGRPLPPGMSWSKGSGRKFVDESDEEDNLSNQKFFPPPPPPPLISPPSSSPPSAFKASAAAAAAAGGAGGGKSPSTPPQPLPPLISTPSPVAASLEKQSSPRPPLPPPPSFGHKQPASPRRLSGDSPKAAADASAAVASTAGPGSGTSSPGAITGAGATSKAGGNTAAAAATAAVTAAGAVGAAAAASSPKARSSSPSRPPVVIPPVVPLPTLKSLNSGKNPRGGSAAGALGVSGAAGAAAGVQDGDAGDRNRGKEAERGGEKGKAGSEKPSAPAAAAVGVAYGNAGRALRAADLELEEKGAGGSATGDGSSVGGDDDGSDTGGAAGSGAASAAAAGGGGVGMAAGAGYAGLGRGGASRGGVGSGRELGSPGGGGGTWAGGSDAASEASEESGKGGWERAFSLSELALATNDFGARGQRNVVGRGGNGTVYKARLPDGTTVAVKRLGNKNPDQTVREFRFEADAMAHARHPNVVALLGCCAEGDERMLVSEFVPNGSLELWLHGAGAGAGGAAAGGGGAFGAGPTEPMEWPLRVHVALGCARGLAYLHEGTDVRVVHRDVKASNVLLDAQWNPKLGDFALAKIMAKEQTHAATRVVGTYGYVAPEYLNTGILTERSDVYSYGVLLLELVTGRRPIDNHLPPEQVDVVRWVKRLAAEERVGEALDPRIAGTVPADDVEYVVGIALRCIDANALKRPRMKQIVHMLESEDPALRDGWVAKRPTPASAKALRDSSPSWYHRNAASDSPAAPSSATAAAMAISRASPRGSSPRFGGAGPGIPAPGSARAAGTRHTDILRSGSPRNFVGGATGSSPKAADIGGMIASAAMKAGVVGGSPRAGGYIGYSPTRSGGAVSVSPPSARNGGGGGGASAGGGAARVGASPPKVPNYAQGGSPSAARLGGVGMGGAGGMRGGSPGGAGYRTGSSPNAPLYGATSLSPPPPPPPPCLLLTSSHFLHHLLPFFLSSVQANQEEASRVANHASRVERTMAQPRKFLVAVDDSEVSAYAFTWAITNLFRPADSALVLTAKNYAPDMPLPTADIAAGGEYAVPLVAPVSQEEQLAVEERARALVDKYMRQCEQAKVVSEGEVVQGDPGPHIVSEAARVAADALVLGSHGRGILGRTFLGSISDYVRHHSTVPVVIVRQPKAGEAEHDALTSSGMARRIVVAVDESSEAEFAFAWAMRHVVRDGDRLTVLHVQNPIAAPTSLGIDQFGMEDVYMPPDTSNRANVRALDDSEKLVERFMALVAASSKAECEGRVVMGPTEERLVEELKQLTADLAIVGTRDHDVISRTFLGSVSDYLAHNCPCPLVVAKMPKPASRPGSTQASPRDSHQHAI
ncbi:unnamed protein product [Closterium sp. NIES-53]